MASATPNHAAMPVVTEYDRTFGTIRHTIETLHREDFLISAAEALFNLAGLPLDKPIEDCEEGELRSRLLKSAEYLYNNDPEMLSVIENFLDAIARARLKVVLGRRAGRRAESV